MIWGILIILCGLFMLIFPEQAFKLKGPVRGRGMETTPNMIKMMRIWGVICIVAGVVMCLVKIF